MPFELALSETLLALASVVVWAGVMLSSRDQIVYRLRQPHQRVRTILFLLLIWVGVAAFLTRALYDLEVLDATTAGLVGAMARGLFVLIGAALLVTGGREGEPPR